MSAPVPRPRGDRIFAFDGLWHRTIGSGKAERSVLQTNMPNGNCLKGGPGDTETTGTSLAQLRAIEAEPFDRCEFGANTATASEMEGPRLVGAKIAASHRRNRVALVIGNVKI